MISLWASGIKPTLSLNFAGANTLDSLFTFTRSGAQTYFDSTGTLQTAATDVAAFDYNPSTLAPLGLSMWEARTNGMLYCRDFTNAAWTVKTTVTIAKDQTGIDGAANSASSVLATGATSVVSQAIVQAATSSTLSFYVKRLIGTGTITIKQTASTLDITALINSSTWTRVTLTASVLNPVIGFIIATSGDKIAVDYGSFEVGAFATPAILTTAAAATRAAPVCSTTNLGWYNATQGTLLVSQSYATGSLTASPSEGQAVRIWDGTANNLMSLRFVFDLTAPQLDSVGVVSGVNQWDTAGYQSLTPNTTVKSALAYAANDVAQVTNGGAAQTDTSCSIPVVDRLSFVLFRGGWIFSLTYYPLRLPNSTLQALTA